VWLIGCGHGLDRGIGIPRLFAGDRIHAEVDEG
jgi:hypothetical protein